MNEYADRLIKELMKSKWGRNKIMKVATEIQEEKIIKMCEDYILKEFQSISIPKDAVLKFETR